MRKLARMFDALAQGCGKIPLLAALLLIASAQLTPVLGPPAPPTVEEMVGPQLPADFAIIDSVLAKRAPELGLTLRNQLAMAIAEEAERASYDPLLILAVIDVESDFEESAVSEKGARGLMQIQPTTLYFLAEKHGLKLSREELAGDPILCVRLGIRYLRTLQNSFGGSLEFALMAYNAGPTRIRTALREQGLEPFRRYPQLVRRDFRRFRRGAGLEGDWALALRTAKVERQGRK